jgi:predicted RNA binding protein YcfA (HicA-like mRNA interferase family)
VKVREAVRLIGQGGWSLVVTQGSHRQYMHPTKPGRVTIAREAAGGLGSGYAQQHSQAGRGLKEE